MENKNSKHTQTNEENNNGEIIDDENIVKCDVCGEYHKKSTTHSIEVKGRKKYICQGCADTVHGLV